MLLDLTDDESSLIQAITWANVDSNLYRYMESLGYNEYESRCINLLSWKGIKYWLKPIEPKMN